MKKHTINLFGTQGLRFCAISFAFIAAVTACDNGMTSGSGGGNTNVSFTVTFIADNGSDNTTYRVAKGEKLHEPSEPEKPFAPGAGLYTGTLPDAYTFEGWYNGAEKWDFDNDTVDAKITLKAKWGDVPVANNISSQAGNNIIAKAIAYIKDNAEEPANEYILLLNTDVNCAPQTLDADNINLTIEGIGGERKINLSEQGILFTVGEKDKTGIELILGNNVTLVGRGIGGAGNSLVVKVENGAKLTMRDGSKITGNTSNSAAYYGAAVYVSGGEFIMEGGTVTGNTGAYSGSNLNVGGIMVTESGKFAMEGGSVRGNTGTCGDVYISPNAVSFTLSGDAAIGNLTLGANSTKNASVTVASALTGSDIKLNLRGSDPAISANIGYWKGKAVLEGASNPSYTLAAADVGKFTLGDFISSASSSYTQPIAGNDRESGPENYEIGNSGADIGKLVLEK
jgi:hypothetical protein